MFVIISLPPPLCKHSLTISLEKSGSDVPTTEDYPRWEYCNLMASKNLGWLVSWRYVKIVHAYDRRKQMAEQMVKEMKAMFAGVTAKAEWMDKETKAAVRKKLNAMGLKLGFPDWLLSDPAEHFIM